MKERAAKAFGTPAAIHRQSPGSLVRSRANPFPRWRARRSRSRYRRNPRVKARMPDRDERALRASRGLRPGRNRPSAVRGCSSVRRPASRPLWLRRKTSALRLGAVTECVIGLCENSHHPHQTIPLISGQSADRLAMGQGLARQNHPVHFGQGQFTLFNQTVDSDGG